jgi:hypothetical protein
MIEPQTVPALAPASKLLQLAKLALAWSVIAGGFVALAASVVLTLSAARAEPAATASYGQDLGGSSQVDERSPEQGSRS